MEKITILGDIMTEPGLLAQTKTETGYDYKTVFSDMEDMLGEADYVIVNLETPLAGEEAGYTQRIVSFNAPDELAIALKNAGADFAITANNHAIDRGVAGLKRTVKVLDEIGLAHTGTYAEKDDPRIAYFTVGNTKVAVIAATYGINSDINDEMPEPWMVNMLRPFYPNTKIAADPRFVRTKQYVESLLGHKMLWEAGIGLKRAMGVPIAHTEAPLLRSDVDPYLEILEKDLAEAKKNADVVIFCPHTGGQFNVEPGETSKYIAAWAAEKGFDAMFAAHSHTTQPAVYLNGMPCFYCLGNVTMSSNTVYSVAECLPDYGVAAHLYVADGKVQKTSFSIYKIVENEGEVMRVVPVEKLESRLSGEEKEKFCRNVLAVYNRVACKQETSIPIQSEYEL